MVFLDLQEVENRNITQNGLNGSKNAWKVHVQS